MSMETEHSLVLSEQPVLFFDGVCGLCNRLVNISMRLDKKKTILYAPLQGELAKVTLPPMGDDAGEWTMQYWDGEQVFEQSDATLELCRVLGGMMKVFLVFKVVPKGLRDLIYRAVARSRYTWFGTLESCRIPSEEEQARFLP